MASNFESSIHRGSDLFCDFSCFICQEKYDRNTEAEFYCEECSVFLCGKCMEHHNTLYKKHATLGKENISQWPGANVDALEPCQEHKKEKLTGFCEDHNQLICHACHMYNHQKCSHVVLIADTVKDHHQKGDFKQFVQTLYALNRQFLEKTYDFEDSMKSFEKSYNLIMEEIKALRKKINDSLDELEKNTVQELDTLLATMKMTIQTDIKNCKKSIIKMNCVHENWLKRKHKSEAENLILYRKCLDQSLKTKAVLQAMTTMNERTLTFNADTTIQQTLSTLSGLGQILNIVKPSQAAKSTTQKTVTRQEKTKPGNLFAIQHWRLSDVTKPSVICDPNQVIRVKSTDRKMYSFRVKDDSDCIISAICETATGELLITDWWNRNMKLLDQTYTVVAHCDLPAGPWSMCRIDASLVAVTLTNRKVQFIRVTNGQLVKDRILELQHNCLGFAHHQGNLYITDYRALYHYTVDGGLVSKMYEDTSGRCTVTACAVSPDGDRIYVNNKTNNQLVTLSRDGTVISTFTDPALDWGLTCVPPGLHVTDSGQVLVIGVGSNTIIQVDKDGRQGLAEVVSKNYGVTHPTCVYYSKNTSSLIVGMSRNDNITVFKAQ